MNATINTDGKSVTITLTPEQVAQVKQATINYTDIKTVEQAFDFLGLDYKGWLTRHEDIPDDVLAYMKLRIIVKAINGGKVMDYKNTNEYKYYPWFNAVGSSAGFSFFDFDCDSSYSSVGSRLCFIDSDRAKYAGKQFIEIYNEYINATEQ